MSHEAGLLKALLIALMEEHWHDAVRVAEASEPGAVQHGVLAQVAGSQRQLFVFLRLPRPAVLSQIARSESASVLAVDASLEELQLGLGFLEGGRSVWAKEAILALTAGQETPRVELTARELQVLQLVSGGNSNLEVAAGLGISPNTVRSHLQSIFDRFGVSSRGHLVARARELGITDGQSRFDPTSDSRGRRQAPATAASSQSQ